MMRPFLALALVSCVLAGDAVARSDAIIRPGDGFEGRVATGDEYVARFTGLAGEVLSVSVKAVKVPKTASLAPRIEVFDVTAGDVVATAEPKRHRASLKVALATTGVHEIRVSGADGTSGGFSARTRSKLDKSARKPTSEPGAGSSGARRVVFVAKADSALNATIRPEKKSDAVPGPPQLMGPDGALVIPEAFVTVKGTKTVIKRLPLPAAGEYTLSVDNLHPAGSGEVELTVRLRVARHKKRKIVDYAFGGTPVVTPDVVYVGEEPFFAATIALTDTDTKKRVRGASLVRVDGGRATKIAEMFDDGFLAGHGDEIDGDRVYTMQTFLKPEQGDVGFAEYVVLVELRGSRVAQSRPVRVLTAERLTQQELQDMEAMQSSMQTTLHQAVLAGTLDETLDGLLDQLRDDPRVSDAGRNEGGRGLWLVYACGIPAVVYQWDTDDKSGSAMESAARRRAPPVREGDGAPSVVPPYDAYFPEDARATQPPAGLTAFAASGEPGNVVGSNKARVIAAQHFDWGENDDIPEMHRQLVDDGCFDVEYTRYTAAGAGTVEDFKRLSDYGLILVSSHGDSFFQDIAVTHQAFFGIDDRKLGQVVVHSNMEFTLHNARTYEDDLRRGRLVLWGDMYGMTPAFFRHHSGAFPNSLVYVSVCRGTFNTSLAKAFLDKGAGVMLGYDDYVAVSFCRDTGPGFLGTMLQPGKTVADAYQLEVEDDRDPAAFLRFGSATLELDAERLHDAGFESGNIDGAWETTGDARIVADLNGFGPTEGGRMAIISTGLGFTTSSGQMSQTLCLPADATLVTFDWNFFSEEFTEFCGTLFQDSFTVTLTEVDDPGNTTTLLHTYVDALCDDVFEVPFHFDQPADPKTPGVFSTGWRSEIIDVPPAFAGKRVRLAFGCTDVGDSQWDTAVLIDDICIVEPAP